MTHVKLSILGALIAALAATCNNDGLNGLPPTGDTSLKPYLPSTNSPSFVTAKGGKLYLDGVDWTFAGFNNVSQLDSIVG